MPAAILEIEMKFRAANWDTARAALAAWGASPPVLRREADHYFNAPDRDFAATNEALRLRVVDGRGTLTYKGPRQPGRAKTRREIEVPLDADAEAVHHMTALMAGLGYKPVAVVNKQRETRTFLRGGFEFTACFDEVDRVGKFIEIEVLTPETERNEAEIVLLEVCQALGLSNPEPRSYLRMFLENQS
jgi:adenylate cyclase class 2